MSIRRSAAGVALGLVAAACELSALDFAALEESIRAGFADQQQIEITAVDCPEDVAPAAGDVFLCTALGDEGTLYNVEVTQTDDRGNVTWMVTGTQ